MDKRTKIIGTIGPASENQAMLNSLVKNGLNIARLNFSHGTHASHKKLIKNIKAVAKKNKKPIGIIADLQGPKIRIGDLKEPIEIKKGQKIIFTARTMKNPPKYGLHPLKFPISYKKLYRDLKPGNRILIDDGLIEVKVEKIKNKNIIAKVINGGKVSSHKGMNFPDSKISLSSLTKKDKNDLTFAIKEKVDFIALSFVRTKKDVDQLKGLIKKYSKRRKDNPKIIAKIEKSEALKNFSDILKSVDAVMVARGDLGIEIPAEDVPVCQKEIVSLCRKYAKPVIIATQMLDSMIRNPRPTRAEVSDVANSVMDNVDAVMLSGESATGKYPSKAVKMMKKIILETEASPYDDVNICGGYSESKQDGIGKSIAILIEETKIKQVVDLTNTGLYRYVSKWRPEAKILTKTDEHNLYPILFWGICPFISKAKDDKTALAYLKKNKLLVKKYILLTGEDNVEIVD